VASAVTIDPGESGSILVTADRPPVGPRDLLVRVASNDPVEAEQTLVLRFEVVP
jgi:hypothetical protein